MTLHKFSRVRPSTIFSFAIILIWYLLAAMFVRILLPTCSLSVLSHNIKPLWFVIDYLSESYARTEGTLGEALGQVPKARSKGLEWLATKGELLAAKGVGYADRNTEVERSEILVLRHPLLCPFVLFSTLRSIPATNCWDASCIAENPRGTLYENATFSCRNLRNFRKFNVFAYKSGCEIAIFTTAKIYFDALS